MGHQHTLELPLQHVGMESCSHPAGFHLLVKEFWCCCSQTSRSTLKQPWFLSISLMLWHSLGTGGTNPDSAVSPCPLFRRDPDTSQPFCSSAHGATPRTPLCSPRSALAAPSMFRQKPPLCHASPQTPKVGEGCSAVTGQELSTFLVLPSRAERPHQAAGVRNISSASPQLSEQSSPAGAWGSLQMPQIILDTQANCRLQNYTSLSP